MEAEKVKLWTYSDLLSLPENGRQYELWDGELIMVPSPTAEHQTLLTDLAYLVQNFVRAQKLGRVLVAPLDVIFTETWTMQPDIIYISRERMGIIQDRIRGAPDLAVEILSPSTTQRDRVEKRVLYARFGVQEYWLVDPKAKQVEVLTLREGEYETAGLYGEKDTLTSPLLKGLSVPLNQVFE